MGITASELRANIFRLLDGVLKTGLPLEIVRKGKKLRIVPVDPPPKLGRLVPREEFIRGDPADLVHLDWTDEWSP